MKEQPYYLTQEGYNQLKQEYRTLVKEEKPKIIKKIKEARAKGNLEDNPEYDSVREEQMHLEGKILEIEQILERSKIVDTEHVTTGKITIGSTVTVEIEGEKETYQIVGSAEADPGNGKISYESPVGKSLLGLKPGDNIEVKLPHVLLKYRVIKIHES
ncbi:transcription elongation factor GreA [candidate division WWE3 bacterium]|uniref:Transcription elongation factor GreA n=1 Tax=candidate division WWE3 bacterium TaxID=2053526 RepID=A0A955LGT2_UNCKA|nr:transcription elongation factor GreA [candidate division WWE3 bacterium]